MFSEPIERARTCVRCGSVSNPRGECADTCDPCVSYLREETDEDPKIRQVQDASEAYRVMFAAMAEANRAT